MKRNWKLLVVLLVSSLLLGSVLSAFAQQQTVRPSRVQRPDEPPPPPPPDSFMFIASEMSFEGKVVKGVPYSAEAVTETVQVLGDGNRIVNRSTAAIFRDSEGRTRREQTLKAIGSFANAGGPLQTIFITDPVEGVHYVLDTRTHVAHKMPPKRVMFKIEGPGSDGPGGPPADLKAINPPVFERSAPPPRGEGAVIMQWRGMDKDTGTEESLGRQNIEGVEAEGVRRTVTIPAGEIGNDRPIEIVSERWYSPELQVVVMNRHSDPRFGETTYRLTNINRGEPEKSLFVVPPEFTIKTDAMGDKIRMRQPGFEQ